MYTYIADLDVTLETMNLNFLISSWSCLKNDMCKQVLFLILKANCICKFLQLYTFTTDQQLKIIVVFHLLNMGTRELLNIYFKAEPTSNTGPINVVSNGNDLLEKFQHGSEQCRTLRLASKILCSLMINGLNTM